MARKAPKKRTYSEGDGDEEDGGSYKEHEKKEIKAHKESIAEDERTHGEIDSMKKLVKKIARKKR